MDKTRQRLASTALLGLIIGLFNLADGVTLTRGPYLQSVDSTSAILIWRTNLPGSTQVDYGVGTYTHSIDLPVPTRDHIAVLTDLITGTEVLYRISTDGVELASSSFHTAAAPDQAFSFAVVGDSGWWQNTTALYQVASRMAALDPQFVLHTGDVVYPDGQADGYDPFFFQPYQGLIRRAPFFPVLGNHDYHSQHGQPYFDAFYLPHNNPAGTERYYSFDWGNAHFTALDFNTGPEPEQIAWLKNDLAATDKTWKFVFYHQAMYSSGPHGHESWVAAARAQLSPIFEENQVDMVFNGHDHDYERTLPINDVVYIVSGGGGGQLYQVNPQPFSAYAETTYHTVFVSIDQCQLTLRAVKPDGTIFDSTTLTKECAAPTLTPTSTDEPTPAPSATFAPVAPCYLPIIWKRI